jgi:aminoglycoside phosphotransferase (APT) family kinase protein
MDAEQWRDRLTRAHSRFPDVLTPELVARLHALPEAVEAALARLRDGPTAWIHCDAHLDNVLWRSDGSAVVLDWCNAAIGPPAVDLAGLLNPGVEPRWRPALTAAYANEIERRSGRPAAVEIELAVTHLLQATIGWAGREDLPATGRPAVACRSALRSILRWADASGLQ